MTSEQKGNEELRELAGRSGDGIVVTLAWRPADGRVTVAVADARTGEAFELDVPGDRALDAFQHPYAWAAALGAPAPHPAAAPTSSPQ